MRPLQKQFNYITIFIFKSEIDPIPVPLTVLVLKIAANRTFFFIFSLNKFIERVKLVEMNHLEKVCFSNNEFSWLWLAPYHSREVSDLNVKMDVRKLYNVH